MPRVTQSYAVPPGNAAGAVAPGNTARAVAPGNAAGAVTPGNTAGSVPSARPAGTAAGVVTADVPVLGSGAAAVRVAREFARSIAGGAIGRDRSGAVLARELTALDASGLLGITVPHRYGGADVPASVLAEVVRAIAGADPAIAQVPQGHFLLVDVLAVLGTPSQRHRLLTAVLAGARLGNAMAERGGRPARDLNTRLSGSGTGTRLSGRKYGCTGAPTARWIGVTALDDAGRLVLAFVERDAPGVHLDEDWNAMGQRAAVSGGARFDDVAIDPCLVVPYYRAFGAPQQFGARSQLVHAAIVVGIAGGALQEAGEFARASANRDSTHRYGQLAARVRVAEALLASAAATLDEVGRVPRDAAEAARGSSAVAEAKAFGSDVAAEVAADLFWLVGAGAADERHDLGRRWPGTSTHGGHGPAARTYRHLLDAAPPPNHGQN